MVKIKNLKEKELLIANYFCGKSRKEYSPINVWDMWSNWFKNDFRINGQVVFKMMNDGNLSYRPDVKIKKDISILKKYNRLFKNIYAWINSTLRVTSHDKEYFHQALDRERKRGFSRVLAMAKPLGFYVTLGTDNLYKNKLGYFQLVKGKNTVISGDCDKIIEFLKKKTEGDKACNVKH